MKQNSPSPAISEMAAATSTPKKAPACRQPVTDDPPFTLEQLKKLADRYAPVVRLHPQEPYFMCTVDWYLQHSTLFGPNGYQKKSPAVDDLPSGTIDDGKWYLVMTDDAKKGDLSIARTYVHAYWQSGDDYTDLQYWFCYGYNGHGTMHCYNPANHTDVDLSPLGEHWIDWEQVTIRIKNDTQAVLGVYLSQHGDGEWITDLTRFQRQGDQFIVYASLNGHAVYAQPGTNPTHAYDILGVIGFYLRNDTADGGYVFDCKGKLDIVSADFIPGFTEPKWLHFPYRYGVGSDSHITKEAVEGIINGVLGPIGWIMTLLDEGEIADLAEAILPEFTFDDTNGVYGPQTQSYWTSQGIPAFNINVGYTGWNTNPSTPPSIVWFNGLWHLFFMDHGGNGVMHVTSLDGLRWDQPESFYTGVNTSSGPCAVVFKGMLYVFFRDGNGNGILFIESADGKTYKPAQNWYIGLNCDGQPSAAVLGDKLCVTAVDHSGNGIMRAIWSGPGSQWSVGYTQYNTNNVNPFSPPCISAFAGLFHIFFMDHNGRGIMHLTSRDAVTWDRGEPFYTGFNTSAGPASVVAKKNKRTEMLYVFFRDGNGNGILYIQSADGKSFTPAPCWYIGLNCDYEPRIAATPDEVNMCLVSIDRGGNGIMRAVFTPW